MAWSISCAWFSVMRTIRGHGNIGVLFCNETKGACVIGPRFNILM
jgi:hypothetical protein